MHRNDIAPLVVVALLLALFFTMHRCIPENWIREHAAHENHPLRPHKRHAPNAP